MSDVKKLVRPIEGRTLGGFCAGLANFFGLDPVLVRLGYIFLCLFSAGFPGLLLYLIALLIVPSESVRPKNDESHYVK